MHSPLWLLLPASLYQSYILPSFGKSDALSTITSKQRRPQQSGAVLVSAVLKVTSYLEQLMSVTAKRRLACQLSDAEHSTGSKCLPSPVRILELLNICLVC